MLPGLDAAVINLDITCSLFFKFYSLHVVIRSGTVGSDGIIIGRFGNCPLKTNAFFLLSLFIRVSQLSHKATSESSSEQRQLKQNCRINYTEELN